MSKSAALQNLYDKDSVLSLGLDEDACESPTKVEDEESSLVLVEKGLMDAYQEAQQYTILALEKALGGLRNLNVKKESSKDLVRSRIERLEAIYAIISADL